MADIDRKEVQGLLRTAYPDSRFAAYHLLEIVDGPAARRWLASIQGIVTYASESEDADRQLNIAFSAAGLEKLGLPENAMQTFPGAFREGMSREHRANILGDIGQSAPQWWDWGGTSSAERHATRLHVLLLAFAHTQQGLDALAKTFNAGMGGALVALPGSPLPARVFKSKNNFEHFGFRDGISQPLVKGLHDRAGPALAEPTAYPNVVEPGEFILGYKNSQGLLPPSPSVACDADPSGKLTREAPGMPGRRDLGRNSSFLVFRHLAQDVPAFWNYVHGACPVGTPKEVSACEPLAAKMVGRWRNGSPLVEAWAAPDASREQSNNFSYRDADAAGLRCPVGAHIRRAGPRDSFGETKQAGLESTALHRLIRRGRGYGEALGDDAKFSGDQANRGLYFICLNASIERQFEFVQHTWINGSKVGDLYDERDPVAGNPSGEGRFSIPRVPTRTVLEGIPSFITVKGGGYFFLPGRQALAFLGA